MAPYLWPKMQSVQNEEKTEIIYSKIVLTHISGLTGIICFRLGMQIFGGVVHWLLGLNDTVPCILIMPDLCVFYNFNSPLIF